MIDKYSCNQLHENPEKHCQTCDDDSCQDGRTLEVVNQYASTCDGCGELTHHELMEMDEETQLGYCPKCDKL